MFITCLSCRCLSLVIPTPSTTHSSSCQPITPNPFTFRPIAASNSTLPWAAIMKSVFPDMVELLSTTGNLPRLLCQPWAWMAMARARCSASTLSWDAS
ncbi:hypothetical protein FVEG_14979 [Fusarium verticillioides 7600]|uniref:Uncharacterized protein n=1 Tax=Gibberella moniliformis (strain M3125 / FGSC 7600) TaxID=334819 RepID=W7LUJ0_GIBM7|nr:hypothetical protein FVEG_14979 [Fusarium verticillioides 7600]EWG39124.1 hypothetical protein FVEG_14979 [Fusarium verticillioides 7600]